MIRKIVFVATGLFLIHGLSFATNLVQNGDFEQPFAGSWDTLSLGIGGQIERSDTLGLGMGFAAKAYRYLGGYSTISQTINVPNIYLDFSFDGRFDINDSGSSVHYWPIAAFIIHYEDSLGYKLGSSRFYKHNGFCDWQDTDTTHLIEVDQVGWHHFSGDIYTEVMYFLWGIPNPQQMIRKIKFEIMAANYGDSGSATAQIALDNVTLTRWHEAIAEHRQPTVSILKQFSLTPNPVVNDKMKITYQLYRPSHIVCTLHDALGRQVVRLFNVHQNTDPKEFVWQPRLKPGSYFISFMVNDKKIVVGRLILVSPN